jgi:Uma2 family endonuclease
MSTAPQQRRFTPDDLLWMPDGERYELVNGDLVERNMGWEASWIGGRLHHVLSRFCDTNLLAWVAPADASYQCFPDDPSKVRRPDVSVIRRDRLSADLFPQGHCLLVPDLAAEVVSPNDFYSEVEEKVVEYLRAGVRLVWVINPRTRTVRVHRRDGTVTDLDETAELDGEDVLPGFRCPVRELFAGSADSTPVGQVS